MGISAVGDAVIFETYSELSQLLRPDGSFDFAVIRASKARRQNFRIKVINCVQLCKETVPIDN